MALAATNYNAQATAPTECTYTVEGCTDSLASNYLPTAAHDSGTCLYVGCADSIAPSYDPSATVSGWCDPHFPGCTDPSAENYKVDYTLSDGSCSYGGCADAAQSNYNPRATFDDGTCVASRRELLVQAAGRRRLVAGCLDPASSNYDASATPHQSSLCQYAAHGSHALAYHAVGAPH
jgi:hypothetical protein